MFTEVKNIKRIKHSNNREIAHLGKSEYAFWRLDGSVVSELFKAEYKGNHARVL